DVPEYRLHVRNHTQHRVLPSFQNLHQRALYAEKIFESGMQAGPPDNLLLLHPRAAPRPETVRMHRGRADNQLVIPLPHILGDEIVPANDAVTDSNQSREALRSPRV